jgi:hypothetical protein
MTHADAHSRRYGEAITRCRQRAGIERAGHEVEVTFMLRRLRDLGTCEVTTTTGEEIGKVNDFYFDDEKWTIRYVVVKAGNWGVPAIS